MKTHYPIRTSHTVSRLELSSTHKSIHHGQSLRHWRQRLRESSSSLEPYDDTRLTPQVGQNVVRELVKRGHSVVGLAHHDGAAKTITSLGGTAHTGSIYDIESLRAGASNADAVIHLAYNHDFVRYEEAAAADFAAIQALVEALGQGKPYVGTTAPIWNTMGKPFVESDVYEESQALNPRGKGELYLKAKGKEGYKTSFVRLPPTVHGANDPNFITVIVNNSKKAGKVGYVNDGSHKWAAVNVEDAARLYVDTLEGLENGSVHAGQTIHADEAGGYETKLIAQTIADKLKIDAVSVTADEARELYTPYIGSIWGYNIVIETDITRKVTGWKPTADDLIADLKSDLYVQ